MALAILATTFVGGPAANANSTDPGHGSLEYAKTLSATVANSADPEAAIHALSEADRDIFYAAITPVAISQETAYEPVDAAAQRSGVDPDQVFSPMATGCWIGTTTKTWTNAFGGHLYSMTAQAHWCASAGTVTMAQRWDSWGDTYWLGWTHAGLVGTDSAVINNTAKTYFQHKFVYAPAGGTLIEQSPCLRHTGTQAGTTSSWLSLCGVY